MSQQAIVSIRASIKQLNEDYTELNANYKQLMREFTEIHSTIVELRTEVKWLKTLMLPIALASIASAVKILLG